MKTGTVLFAFAAALVLMSPIVFAASEADQRRLRFNQLLALMKDNGDRIIDASELEEFLLSKAGTIAARLRDAGFMVTAANDETLRRFVHRQAELIINGPAGRGRGITEDRLAVFEDADLEYPFPGKVRELLPPPTAAGTTTSLEDKGAGTPSVGSVFDVVPKWVSVRKSYLQAKDVGQPASLSVTHFNESDATQKPGSPRTGFDVRGALAVSAFEFTHELGNVTLDWNPVAAIEADVSSDASVGRDKITHRVGAEGVLFQTVPTPWLSGHNLTATFDYTTDRDYRTALLGGTVQYSPNFRLIGVGEYKQLGTLPLFFRWRPYLGLTGAGVTNDGDKKALKNMGSYINGYVRIGGDLLIGTRFHLTPELIVFQQLEKQEREHSLFNVSLRYSFDDSDHVSVEASYTRGKDSPEFINQDQFKFGVGIKF